MQTVYCVVYLGMKKHEALKYAYDNYPKGTLIKWSDIQGTVDGVYNFDGDGRIVDSTNFVVHNTLKFAKIIKEKPTSILDGKVAIQVNNEREFKLLMEHYESKGWKWCDGDDVLTYANYAITTIVYPALIEYNDSFGFNTNKDNYDKIIPFADFAKEVGIEVPEFIMNSEDGVDLYEGDLFWTVSNDAWENETGTLKWEIKNSNGAHKICIDSAVFKHKERNKAFSTKEAAETWIEEQNKPKEIEIEIHSKGSILITHDMIRINGVVTELTSKELDKIYHAQASLQALPF